MEANLVPDSVVAATAAIVAQMLGQEILRSESDVTKAIEAVKAAFMA